MRKWAQFSSFLRSRATQHGRRVSYFRNEFCSSGLLPLPSGLRLAGEIEASSSENSIALSGPSSSKSEASKTEASLIFSLDPNSPRAGD